MFSELFQNIDFPILVCNHDTVLSVCYGNPSAAYLLSLPEGDLLGQPLQQLLRIPFRDYEAVKELFCSERKHLKLQSYFRRSGIGRIPLRLSANTLSFQGKTYLKLCLDRRGEDAQAEDASIQSLILAAHAANEAHDAQEAILRILAITGEALSLHRLRIFEAEDEKMLRMSYEWSSPEAESCDTFLHQIPRQNLYSLLMETELPDEKAERVFASGDDQVLAASPQKSILSLPLLFEEESLGYLIAEDNNGLRRFLSGDVWFMKEISHLLASVRKRLEQERCQQYHLDVLNTVTHHLDGMICVHDPKRHEILFANSAFSDLFCIPLKELLGKDRQVCMRKLWQEYSLFTPNEENTPHWEFYNPKTAKWYLAKRSRIKWIDGSDAHVDRMVDITEQKERTSVLERIASTDHMTGTYNRDWACRLMQRLLQDKAEKAPASLVFVDLDNLKCVNDQFGHCEGDRMIMRTVHTIQSCIRKTDAVCRWGGDEFLVILMANESESARIMDSVLKQVKTYNALSDSPCPLSFSYGIAEIRPGTGQSVETLVAEADQKMYHHKTKNACKRSSHRLQQPD